MKDRELLKAIVGLVASAGVGVVVKNAIKATSPLEPSRMDKALIGVGTFVITGAISKHIVEYTDSETDLIVNTIEKLKGNSTEEAPKEGTYLVGETTDDQ